MCARQMTVSAAALTYIVSRQESSNEDAPRPKQEKLVRAAVRVHPAAVLLLFMPEQLHRLHTHATWGRFVD